MIDLLDQTLSEILKAEVPEVSGSTTQITFEPPNQMPTEKPAVNIFLYDIRENLELRSTEWRTVVRQPNGSAPPSTVKIPPPVRVDCSYLVTCYGSDARNEHAILGRVMAALLRYPKIPEAFMPEDLRRAQTHLPLPTAALHAGRLQSMGEFWQAMGDQPPRAALHYTVTLSVQPFEESKVPLVLTAETR